MSFLYIMRDNVQTDAKSYNLPVSHVTISDARGRLASIVDEALVAPVQLTRRGRSIVTVLDSNVYAQLVEDAQELADLRAVDAAWEETDRLGETAIPWDEVRRDLGLPA